MQGLDLTFGNWFAIVGFATFILTAISTFSFARISVRHIEREMAKEGREPPHWDKGLGARLTMYAITIIMGKSHHSLLIDEESILKHARKTDRYLAIFLCFRRSC